MILFTWRASMFTCTCSDRWSVTFCLHMYLTGCSKSFSPLPPLGWWLFLLGASRWRQRRSAEGAGAFYKRNPFKIHLDQFPPNIDTAFNFTKEIPLKLNRTKKKVYQKIELTFNFTKEIHVKIIRNKKKSTLKFGLKNTL